MPTKEQLYAETVLMDALDLQAKMFSASSKPFEALQSFDLASEIYNVQFAHLTIQNSKLISQQNVKRRSELMMELFYQQYQTTKNLDWIEKAINTDSKSKGRVVSDAVFLKNIIQSQGGDNSKKLQELQQELSYLGNEIRNQSKKKNLDLRKLAELEKSYSQLLTKQRLLYDDFQLEIKDKTNSRLHVNELKEKDRKSTRLNS